jgi:hypothetical protein
MDVMSKAGHLETHPAVQKEILAICRKHGVAFVVSDVGIQFKGDRYGCYKAKEEVDIFIKALVLALNQEALSNISKEFKEYSSEVKDGQAKEVVAPVPMLDREA